MGTGQSKRGVSRDTGLLLQEQGQREMPVRMPPSPLKEAFELIHFYLLHSEEGVEVNTVRLSIWEQIAIDPDRAIGEAVRTGLVEKYSEPVTTQEMIRRGPRSAEMLRWIYGRDNPPTLESIMAEERAWLEFERKRTERLEAIREASRPRERNTLASLPPWVP